MCRSCDRDPHQTTPLMLIRVSGAICPLKFDVGGEALLGGIAPGGSVGARVSEPFVPSSVSGQCESAVVPLGPYSDGPDIQDSIAVPP